MSQSSPGNGQWTHAHDCTPLNKGLGKAGYCRSTEGGGREGGGGMEGNSSVLKFYMIL